MSVILLLEDDALLRRDLKQLLLNEGYSVNTAADLKEARHYLGTAADTDLFLLDVWLPDGDGFDFLTEVRKTSQAPVLFLTACDDEASIIRGLNLGADDYITKPFRKAELLSRIRANLRRAEVVRQSRRLISGGLVMDTERHEVMLNGKILELRPAEYRLLQLFMENPGRLIMRERILDRLQEETWEDPVEDNTLSVHISRLRAAVGPGFIETVRGFGYRFKEEVREDGHGKGTM